VSIEIDNRLLIIDAGTGICKLGKTLWGTDIELYILLSHLHTDHLAAFPFFAPIFEPDRVMHLLTYHRGDLSFNPVELIDGVHFPKLPSDLPSAIKCIEGDNMAFLQSRGFQISRVVVNHPGGAYGYRIEDRGHAVVHIPDNELFPPHSEAVPFDAVVDFCRDADVLIHDAQYVSEDLPAKSGWGHSRVQHACELAEAASVKHLVLFHHDPDRTDEELDLIQEQAQAGLRPHNIACTVAYEGLRIRIPERP
jgi:phosphoribosyl 1,2-cyclic phosphodiesterase